MTCIVAVKTKTGVLLAGDSMGSNGYTGRSYIAPKVFRLNRQVATGSCGSFRMKQLIGHHLDLPPVKGDEHTWAITKFIPHIRTVFKDHGYSHIEHNEETGGNFILAVRGRIFSVQSDYSVLEARHPYYAVGSGEYHASGAIHALYPRLKTKPRELLKAGLDAASAFVVSVDGPYNYTSTAL